MRWMRFEHGGSAKLGSVEDGRVQPVAAADLQGVIRGEGLDPAGEPVPIQEVRALAPLRPGKIVAVGQNYMDHIREQGNEPPGVPVLFPKFPTNVIGPEEQIRWPKGLTQQVDYEAELAVVIGEGGRGLDEEGALDAVFGYTAANDVTARDLQFSEGGQWTRGKAIDTFLPLGPAVVSREEVPDPQALPVACRVNGETLQDSNTKEMVFTVAQLVAFVSQSVALEPGDVILTGTPNGVGVFRDPQVFLQPGDRVEVEVGDFGVLSNPVGEYS
jgi:2-keto-4-pentenoate hydratase/2-oxohepta-3-ene-1,7-dioic acid hydratase in catechol pathway